MGGVAEGVTVDVRCADTGEYDGGGAAHGAEEGCVDWTKLCDGGHCGGFAGWMQGERWCVVCVLAPAAFGEGR